MECTLCGKVLPDGERVCSDCFPAGKTDNKQEEICEQVHRLLRKSKAWVLVGFAILPGWISHPISYWFAMKAMRLYDENQLNNPAVKSRIFRLKVIAGLLSLTYWFFTLLYFI